MANKPERQKTERELLIERLQEQVAKAESKGLYDTSHHQTLARLLGEKIEKTDKGELTNG